MVHLFLHLLLNANHQDWKWRGTDVKRGQVITWRNSLNLATGISEQSLRTCLDRLKSTNEITIKSTSKFSIITVVKYNDYNDTEIKSTKPLTSISTNQQPTTNQQLTTNKNEKNNKEWKEQIEWKEDKYVLKNQVKQKLNKSLTSIEESSISSKEENTSCSFWSQILNEFINWMKTIYEWLGLELKIDRKHASCFYPKWVQAKNRIERITNHWYKDFFIFAKDILIRAKSVKYGNRLSKISTLYWLWEHKEEILNLTKKINEPWTREHFERYKDNIVGKEIFNWITCNELYKDWMYSDYLIQKHWFEKNNARNIRDNMFWKWSDDLFV